MPPSPEVTTVKNVEQLVQPIATITEIVKANTPKHHPSYLEELPQCLTDQTMTRESSPLSSPAKKKAENKG